MAAVVGVVAAAATAVAACRRGAPPPRPALQGSSTGGLRGAAALKQRMPTAALRQRVQRCSACMVWFWGRHTRIAIVTASRRLPVGQRVWRQSQGEESDVCGAFIVVVHCRVGFAFENARAEEGVVSRPHMLRCAAQIRTRCKRELITNILKQLLADLLADPSACPHVLRSQRPPRIPDISSTHKTNALR